jgi:uncharacterized protein YbjT (DUF2867 family)
MTKKISIIGATGMLGLPVTKAFVKDGYEVIALVRNVAKASKLLPENVQIVNGDIADPGSLEKFLDQTEYLYLNLNLQKHEKINDFHTEAEGLQNILRFAKQKKIKRIGFISSLIMNYQGMNNFNWWVFDVKRKAVDMVKKSEIPYTIFYPSTFMDNFNHTYRRGKLILLAGESKQKMSFISANDFAEQVIRSYQILTTENKEYVIQGTEAFTADEAAIIFQKNHTKGKLSISKAPLGLLKFIGNFSQTVNYGANIIEALNNYPEKFEADQTWLELGKPTTSLKDFAQL